MRLEIVIDEVFPRSVETVWRALTEPRALSEWLMEATDFGPEVGARFTLLSEAHDCSVRLVDIEVLDVDPPRRLAGRGRPMAAPRPRSSPSSFIPTRPAPGSASPTSVTWTRTPFATPSGAGRRSSAT